MHCKILLTCIAKSSWLALQKPLDLCCKNLLTCVKKTLLTCVAKDSWLNCVANSSWLELQIYHGVSCKYLMAWVTNSSWLELQISHDLSYKYLMTSVTNSSWLELQIYHDLSYKYIMAWVTNISWLELQISHGLSYKYLMTCVTNISWLELQISHDLCYNYLEISSLRTCTIIKNYSLIFQNHFANITLQSSNHLKQLFTKVKSSFKYRLCSNSLGQHFLLLQAEYYLLLGFNQCKISSLKTQLFGWHLLHWKLISFPGKNLKSKTHILMAEMEYQSSHSQWAACLTRNVEIVGSNPIKGSPLFPWAINFTLIA